MIGKIIREYATYQEPNLCFPVSSAKKPGKMDNVSV